MARLAATLATLALLGAGVATGCGFGPGESQEGEASLSVTRDFGAEQLVDATLEDPTESDTVIRFLDREAEIETSYGGNFVESINGLAGRGAGGDLDWFFFVNGYYSDIGGGEARVRPGDRIWWDYRNWAAAARIPAVVGSWPEPFLHGRSGAEGDGDGAPPIDVQCLSEPSSCDAVVERLEDAGAAPELRTIERPVDTPDALRVLVGPWERLRADQAVRDVESGPARSGVYAELRRCGGSWELAIDGPDGEPAESLAPAGLVAAVQRGGAEPTWLVTGTDEASVADAAELLDADSLRNRYAVAIAGGTEHPIPASGTSGGTDPRAQGCE